MPELDLRKVHEYIVDKATGMVQLVRERHFVSVRSGDVPPLFVQGGKVFSRGGPEEDYDSLPGWFWDEYRRVSPAQRALVGLPLPEEGAPVPVAIPEPISQPAAPQKPPEDLSEGLDDVLPGYWGCTKCGEIVDMKKKGVHVAQHARADKRAAKLAGQEV